jgi:curved DNA-binding protein
MSDSGNTEFVDYYDLLGLRPSADRAQIRSAFIRYAKQHHPDVGGSTDIMRQLNMAYRTLMSPGSKAAYDLLHSFHVGTTEPGDYRYSEGREVHDVTDMSDEEIDSFLSTVLAEYSRKPPKPRPNMKQRVKKFFEI